MGSLERTRVARRHNRRARDDLAFSKGGQVRDACDVIIIGTGAGAHELDNLYAVDTSFFPSISAVNPALTAMANAIRVADHLRERLGMSEASMPREQERVTTPA